MGETTRFWDEDPQQEEFVKTLPPYIYCAGDNFENGSFKRHRDTAMQFPNIQYNSNLCKRYLLFDCDQRNAARAYEKAGLGEPNLVIINPANSHAHTVYGIDQGVTFYAKSSRRSMDFFADVQQGMRRRLDADPAYNGLLAKNPFHEKWVTIRPRIKLYTLGELASYLSKEDMRRPTPSKGGADFEISGQRRNNSIFHWTRTEVAYKEVLRFKLGDRFREFLDFLYLAALDKNHSEFPANPLDDSEVWDIARSIARWTWRHFTPETFSKIQSARVKKRYKGIVTLKDSKPWEAENIHERTWFRRQAKARGGMNGSAQGVSLPYQG